MNMLDRFHPESRSDSRTLPQVDRDRVLYCSAFARLAEVTQVVSADRGYVFHNRLTHSLKVAQLARRISEKLRNSQQQEGFFEIPDPDVAEACALAHDLGHPPFGHIAEEELNELAKAAGLVDGFEGNAQSFRIVSKLGVSDAVAAGSESSSPIRGLNLTRATLNGILKYPWAHGENPDKTHKWGAYETERELLTWVREGNKMDPFAQSVEAAIMDWADDITYAVHDLADFYCAGQIPLDRLADSNDSAERDSFFNEVFERRSENPSRREDLEKTFQEVLEFFPLDRRYLGTRDQRVNLSQFSTVLISRYVNAISPVASAPGIRSVVKIEDHAKDEIFMLKELTWHYVILNSELTNLQHGQKQIVRTVFNTMRKAVKSNLRLFPYAFQEELREAKGDTLLEARIVVDYVASMTEHEIARIYALLSGN